MPTKKRGTTQKRTVNYKKHVGLVPGSVVYTGNKNKKDVLIELFNYDKEKFLESNYKNVVKALEDDQKDPVSWINLNGLNHITEIEKIGNHYDLHPLILEDIVNTTQRPKIDIYENYIFVVIKMLYYDQSENVVSEQVSLVLGRDYVLSFQEADGDVFDPIRDRIRFGKGRIRTLGPDYLFYTLIDAVIDNYYAIIETMGNKIEELEDRLFSEDLNEPITPIIQDLKREILRLRRAIFPLRDIINKIEKSEHQLIEERTLIFFKDIYDHAIQVSESIEIYREMIWGLMDMYMTTISNKMNEVMKVLTIIATIFIPLTFIAGIYGMNFENIPELKYENAYYVLWGVMLVLFVGMLLYFKRKKWL